MNFGRIIVEAWRVTRKTSALRVLGLFSAVQIVLYTVVIGVMVVPMSLLTQLLLSASASGSSVAQREMCTNGIIAASAWLSTHWAPLIVGISALMTAWVVFGVLDVAATAGVITQADETLQHRAASTTLGLSDGFRIWWRTAGLLAISALPSLALMLVGSAFTFFTVTLPLTEGRLPSAAVLNFGNLLTTPLSAIATLVNIPLAVLVALGLRYAVLDGLHWREAFTRAWRLARSRLADVALMYLVVTGVAMAASLALVTLIVIMTMIAGLAAAVLVALGLAGTSPLVIIIAVGAGLILLAGYVLFMVLVLVWQSVSWTVFWRQVTGPVLASESPSGFDVARREGAIA